MHTFRRLCVITALAMGASTPVSAVQDCFTELIFCEDDTPVLGPDLWDFASYARETNLVHIGYGGATEFNKTLGPELIVGAGKVVRKPGTAADTWFDLAKLRAQVHDTDTQAKLSTLDITLRSPDYELFFGYSPYSIGLTSGGVADAPGGRVAALIGSVIKSEIGTRPDFSGHFQVQVHALGGKKLWTKKFPVKRTKWAMLQNVGLPLGPVVGDFLNGDGVDEMRTIYRQTSAKGVQTLEYTYYNLRTGKKIRRDTVKVAPPK